MTNLENTFGAWLKMVLPDSGNRRARSAPDVIRKFVATVRKESVELPKLREALRSALESESEEEDAENTDADEEDADNPLRTDLNRNPTGKVRVARHPPTIDNGASGKFQPPIARLRTSKYLNTIIEADHGGRKRMIVPLAVSTSGETSSCRIKPLLWLL
jgi:hypothetical protein